MKFKMFLIFVSIMVSSFPFVGGNDLTQENKFLEKPGTIQSINIYNDGSVINLARNNEIVNAFKSLLEGAHEMPALGVALHDEIIESLTRGLWVEFVFGESCCHNGLPYEKLLINIEKEFTGFNIIRYINGVYDGRCFYVDLINKDMTDFYGVVFGFVN